MPKWCTPRGIILVKGQLGHFYTFCTMPILIFCPVANFGDQSLPMYPNFEYLEFHKFYKWLSMSYSFIDIYTHTTIFTNWLEYHKFENIFRQADIGFWHFWHIRCMFKRLSIWIGWIEGCIQKWRTNTFLIFIVNWLGTWLRLWFCHIYKSCPSHLAI